VVRVGNLSSIKKLDSSCVKSCDVTSASAHWAFDAVGIFSSTGGNDWNHGFFLDSGRFSKKLSKGQVWITKYLFAPIDTSHSYLLGYPPIRIHHMHSTSSEKVGDKAPWSFVGRPNHDPVFPFAVEFDVHGDRQCSTERGGTDCLMNIFPSGFGMQLVDELQTVFDVNDARPTNSPRMQFETLNAYCWTSSTQRASGRMFQEVGADLKGYFATPNYQVGSYGLTFDPHAPQMAEYIIWGELRFPTNGLIVDMYYHSHHTFTLDVWTISARANSLGLLNDAYRMPGWDTAVNLTAKGLVLEDAMQHVVSHLKLFQRQYLATDSAPEPKIRCRLAQDRWEDTGTDAKPRFSSPRCPEWEFRKDEVFTVISFHRPMRSFPSKRTTWSHTVAYAKYVGLDVNASIPHAFEPLPASVTIQEIIRDQKECDDKGLCAPRGHPPIWSQER